MPPEEECDTFTMMNKIRANMSPLIPNNNNASINPTDTIGSTVHWPSWKRGKLFVNKRWLNVSRILGCCSAA